MLSASGNDHQNDMRAWAITLWACPTPLTPTQSTHGKPPTPPSPTSPPLSMPKLAKLLGPSPFLHTSQHMLGLSTHPGMSYLFQNQNQISPADKALWSIAIGSTVLGDPLGGNVLNSPWPSWMLALAGVSLCLRQIAGSRCAKKKHLPPLFLFFLLLSSLSYADEWRTSMCSHGTVSRTSLPRSMHGIAAF